MSRDELRGAWRSFRRAPVVSLAVVLMMALAIGANTAVFSVVHAVLLRPLPFHQPDRLVKISRLLKDGRRIGVSHPELVDWRERISAVEGLAGMRRETVDLVATGHAYATEAAYVTPNFFSLLGAVPLLGRLPQHDDRSSDVQQAVVLSEDAWRRLFQADPNVVGVHVRLFRKEEERARVCLVAGVVRADFRNLDQGRPTDLFLPELTGGTLVTTRNYGPWYTVIARLRPESTVQQVSEAAKRVAVELAGLYRSPLAVHGAVAEGLQNSQVKHLRPALWVLSTSVAFVLLIACVNVTALLLAAGGGRVREFAVRTALGASNGVLVRQVLFEYLVLTSAAGAAGLWVAKAFMAGLLALAPVTLPRVQDVRLDGAVLLFAAAVSLVSGLALGVAPAVALTRANLGQLMNGTASVLAPGRRRWREWMLGAQFALVLALLIATGLAVGSVSRLLAVNVGFEPTGIAGAEIYLGRRHYTQDRYATLQATLKTSASSLPGSALVALAFDIPPSNETGGDILYDGCEGKGIAARWRPITPGFFELMRIPVVAGRALREADRTSQRLVVNEAFARQCFDRTNVVGARVRRRGSDSDAEIVGVVANLRERGAFGEPEPTAYPFMGGSSREQPPYFWLLVRTRSDARGVANALRSVVARVDPELPVTTTTLDERLAMSWAQLRFYATLLTTFAIFAILLAALGVFATVGHYVNNRIREFGVRLSIGATPRVIERMVLARVLRLALVSAIAGVFMGVAAGRGLGSVLFGVQPADPLTLAAAFSLLVTVAAVAAYGPARRAGSVDPASALRHE